MVESTSLLMKRPGQTGPQVQILSSPFYSFAEISRFSEPVVEREAVFFAGSSCFQPEVGNTW